MAVTATPSGSFSLSVALQNALSGDQGGTATLSASVARTLKVSATAPEIEVGGGWYGVATTTTTPTTIQLAHATDPLQGLGNAAPAQGYTPATHKLCAIYMENQSATVTVTVIAAATNTLAGCGWAASDVMWSLQPYGVFGGTFPAGSTALTAGSNDGVTLTASATTADVKIVCLFF